MCSSTSTTRPEPASQPHRRRPIALTPGDVAGIGPEIIVKAFRQQPELLRGCFVAGDVDALRRAQHSAALGLALPVLQLQTPDDAWDAPPGCLPVLSVSTLAAPVPLGQISAAAGRHAAECVIWAAQAALRGEIAALVTAPLHKEALAAAGLPYPGHTELLQAEAARWLGQNLAEVPVRMMLANDELRVVLLSIHVALRQAIEAVTPANLWQTLLITQRSLGAMLGRAPRIAVAGLNPHAGEGGLFGREEIDIIAPVVAQAQAQGLQVSGPFAPDTVFMRARCPPGQTGEFDVVVAMYHDQGLIPVKYLGVEQGVNVTLGLPLVRTSPDHGTAFDIAGSGRASAQSLLQAVRMAWQLGAAAASTRPL